MGVTEGRMSCQSVTSLPRLSHSLQAVDYCSSSRAIHVRLIDVLRTAHRMYFLIRNKANRGFDASVGVAEGRVGCFTRAKCRLYCRICRLVVLVAFTRLARYPSEAPRLLAANDDVGQLCIRAQLNGTDVSDD